MDIQTIALEVLGPAPWQCRVFKDGAPWHSAVVAWKITDEHVAASALRLDVTYEQYDQAALAYIVHTLECVVTAVATIPNGFRIEAVPRATHPLYRTTYLAHPA